VATLDTQYQAAVKANDAAMMDRILAYDFTLVNGDGAVVTKTDLLKEAKSRRITYEHQEELEQKVRLWGAHRGWLPRCVGGDSRGRPVRNQHGALRNPAALP
jgi:hypothetical protein